ncbi:MAG: S4 domain-containing protein [Thiotrichaceae bacterium]
MAATKRKQVKGKSSLTSVRLDKWLWAARFFKTRKLAGEAVGGGKIHLNGVRVKPAKNVLCGDQLEITRGIDLFSVEVLSLNDKRRPAREARLLYEESVESIEKREAAQELRKLAGDSVLYSSKKPDKRQRRMIRQFKEGQG